MPPASIPVRPTITAGVHFQHVLDSRGTKLLACLLCPQDHVPFFVHRDDFRDYDDNESGLFSAMYARMISHLYSIHSDQIKLPSTQGVTPKEAESPDPDIELLLDNMDAQHFSDLKIRAADETQSLHDAIAAVARKHGSPPKSG